MPRNQGEPKRARRPAQAPGQKGPKSRKSDGTPKKRWSADERRDRGHAPRRSGGQRQRDERSSRDDRGFGRDERAYGTSERRGFDKSERTYGKGERRGFGRGERRDEPRYSRDEPRYSRDEPRYSRDEPRYSRDEPRGYARDDRRGERPERKGRGFSPARPEHSGKRDERKRPWEREPRRRDDRGRGTRRDDWADDRRDVRGRSPRRDEWRDSARDERADAPDQMEWQAADLGDVDASRVSADASFAQLGLPRVLVAALAEQGITDPFPIQAATIPDALIGRDVLGRGQTGSGKTLAFGLPMLTRLKNGQTEPGTTRAVVMVPTRELALQVADVLAPLAKLLRLSIALVAGGMSYGPQTKAFGRGVDIVVATPGRLIDLMDQTVADLSQVEVTVLDEADHMADLGFLPDMQTILDAIPRGQKMLFSATLDRGVDRIVRDYLHEPVTHEVDSDRASVQTMAHHLLHALPHHKNELTAQIAGREGKSIVFVRTQLAADRVAEQLRAAGVMAGALHGGLAQGARSRILAAFKEGTVPVLVATDVAARGIHVDDVGLVLQVDPPAGPKDYLHRAGRTARAGGIGTVVSLVLPHQRRMMRRLAGQAGIHVEPVHVQPGEELLHELTGAVSRAGRPVSEEEYAALVAPRQAQRRPRPARRPRREWKR